MAKEVIPPYWDLSLVTEEYVYLSLIFIVKSNMWDIINAAFWLVELLQGYIML